MNVTALSNLILDNFRIRENHIPTYVDVGGNLARFSSAQHQVLFGRRGSGKSSLLVHSLQQAKLDKEFFATYIGSDETKRLGFPDVLVWLVLNVLKGLPGAKRKIWNFWPTELHRHISELTKLLEDPETSQVSSTNQETSSSNQSVDIQKGPGKAGLGSSREKTRSSTQTYTGTKLVWLERHLNDFKEVIKTATPDESLRGIILIDDFYLIRRDLQPEVIDYIHRLLRGTNLYIKIATIRHRTTLRKFESQTIGVELSQDVEEISLDKTFEDFEGTHRFLHSILEKISKEIDANMEVSALFNSGAPRALTLASGGVPRDFLNIFVEAVRLSVRDNKLDRLTPTYIYKAASTLSYQSKKANIKEEAGFDSDKLERLFSDLVLFCLKEKRKTVFLVKHEDIHNYSEAYELLQQLMDFKLIHIVASDTSAASGRGGRFAAYVLDCSIFMDPRRRNVEIVEFWKIDGQRRQVGVRKSPDYPLERAAAVISGSIKTEAIENVLETIETDENQALPDTNDDVNAVSRANTL